MVERKKTGQPSAAEEGAAPFPKMDLCQKIHQLVTSETRATETEFQAQVFEQIADELENPSLYRKLQKELYDDSMEITIASAKLTLDELKGMTAKHEGTLKELNAKVEEAKESAGDMEVMEAKMAIARFAAKSLSEKEALEAYDELANLPKISSGKKIDALMESARIASFYGDTTNTDKYISKAKKLAEEGGGGDWDRRNRLKVYQALQFLLHRDTLSASKLLLDCIATFSCNEMCSYSEFIVYAIMTNLLHLPRPDLKKKIIDGPEILSVARDIPTVVSSMFGGVELSFLIPIVSQRTIPVETCQHFVRL